MPDEALLDAAEDGELDTEEGLRSTAQEMLNDERSVGMRQDCSQWFIQDQTRYADPEHSLSRLRRRITRDVQETEPS